MAIKLYILGNSIILDDYITTGNRLSINSLFFDWRINSNLEYDIRDGLQGQTYHIGKLADITNQKGEQFISDDLLQQYLGNLAKGLTDSYIQDQTSSPVELFLHNDDSIVTVSSDLSADDQTINLQSGHGLSPGEYIYLEWFSIIFNRYRYYQGEVVTSLATSITVSKPFYEDVLASEITKSTRNVVNMAVDGSITPKTFHVMPPSGLRYDIKGLSISMILTTAPDDGLFGNIARLVKGVFFGIKQPGVIGGYIGSIHDNSDFRASTPNVEYTTRSSGGGSYGLNVYKEMTGSTGYGVVLRLDGDLDQEFIGTIQDDLTAGSKIIQMKTKIIGHLVED